MSRAALLLAALAAGLSPCAPAASETLLRLAELAHVMVHPDELTASLRAEAVAATAAEAQGQLNAAVARAVALAHKSAGVTVATGFYSVWPQSLPGEPVHTVGRQDWHASQSLELRGGDGAVVLALVGALQQQGLAVSQLAWQLAAETQRHARAEATRQALGGLRSRAEDAAAILGLHVDGFREVRLDQVRPLPLQMPRALSAAASLAPPTAEAEDVPVEATVEADVVLK